MPRIYRPNGTPIWLTPRAARIMVEAGQATYEAPVGVPTTPRRPDNETLIMTQQAETQARQQREREEFQLAAPPARGLTPEDRARINATWAAIGQVHTPIPPLPPQAPPAETPPVRTATQWIIPEIRPNEIDTDENDPEPDEDDPEYDHTLTWEENNMHRCQDELSKLSYKEQGFQRGWEHAQLSYPKYSKADMYGGGKVKPEEEALRDMFMTAYNQGYDAHPKKTKKQKKVTPAPLP